MFKLHNLQCSLSSNFVGVLSQPHISTFKVRLSANEKKGLGIWGLCSLVATHWFAQLSSWVQIYPCYIIHNMLYSGKVWIRRWWFYNLILVREWSHTQIFVGVEIFETKHDIKFVHDETRTLMSISFAAIEIMI